MTTTIKTALCMLLAICGSTTLMAIPPSWLDINMRRMKYPAEEYVVGYAQVSMQNDSSAIAAARRNAMGDLVSSLRAHVQTRTTTHTTEDSAYNVQTTFSSSADISSNLEIVNVQTEHYVANGMVYAFAYARRSDLRSYYQVQIVRNLATAEAMLQTAVELDVAGSKIQARKYCLKAKESLHAVQESREMLSIVSPQTQQDTAAENQYQKLSFSTEKLWQQLLQNISVYVDSHEDMFGRAVSVAADKVKAELSKVEWCIFSINKDDADYTLTISAQVNQLSGQSKIVYCTANISAELVDVQKQRSIYNGVWDGKSGHISFENAGKDALSKTADRAAKEIINHFLELKK